MPGAAELSLCGMRAAKGRGHDSGLAEAAELLAKVGEADPVTSRPGPSEAVSLMVQLGAGLPALAKRLVDKIEADEYIDFGDLPPAKGKGRPLGQAFEGQVVVVQAADLVQTRKLIPDVATWVQCFGLFAAAVARKKPQRLPDMMAYMTIVTKASQKYKWPAWVIYDQNFRMEAAGDSTMSWAKVEPSLYAQCFTGQARTAENWCSLCQGLDHPSQKCPYRPQKRAWSAVFGHQPAGKGNVEAAKEAVCIKYNKYNGDCRFGKQCRFSHCCSNCGGMHPAQRCSKPQDLPM